MTSQFPQPPNPWDADLWLEMTRPTLWLVGPWGRCILEAGDDAWPEGKLGGTYCDEQTNEVFAAIAPPLSADPVAHAFATTRPNDPVPSGPGGTHSGSGASFPIEPLVILDTGKPIREDVPGEIAVVYLPATAMLLICAVLAMTVLKLWRRRAAYL